MSQAPEEKPVLSKGRRGCLLAGLAVLAVVVAVILAEFLHDWNQGKLAEYSREVADGLKPGDLDGVWEGQWSWEKGKTARMTIRGAKVSLQNFPVSPDKQTLGGGPTVKPVYSDDQKLEFPFFHGPSESYRAIYVSTGTGADEMLFLKCPSKGELGLHYNCDVTYYYEIDFRRVAK